MVDLLAKARGLAAVEAALEGIGWRWRGENGVAGRRYLTREDPATGAR